MTAVLARLQASLSARPLATGLAAVCAVLATLITYLIMSSVDISPIAPGGAVAGDGGDASALATRLDARPIGEFRETVQRPLFISNRKPVERARAAKSQEAAGSASDLRLVGIVKSGKAPGRALIRTADESNGKWITEGETVNGWRLRSVKDRSVVVESAGRSEELRLQVVVRRADEETDAPPEPVLKRR